MDKICVEVEQINAGDTGGGEVPWSPSHKPATFGQTQVQQTTIYIAQ